MACVALPQGHQVHVHEKPVCPNGATGRLATWQEPGCKNWPKTIHGVDRLNCRWCIYKDKQLKVYDNAKCPDGKDAKLAVYKDSYSRGRQDRTVDVEGFIDTCNQICAEGTRSTCGIKFICNV
ncbi:hypothetical protein QQZ08_005290 [Neonectria magnoliae]|uniref:Secreted protein n=1 Tax=Neonectria magnoliae TaxID=2732573 RepID=A0ABR1I5C2_9HYPO